MNGAQNGKQTIPPAWTRIFKTHPSIPLLIVLIAGFSIIFPNRFLTPMNLSSILGQFVTIILFALGPSMVATIGSLDLSYVGIWMLGGMLVWHLTPSLGIFAILIYPLLGFLTGLMVGTIQVKAKVPSFILTLSLLAAYSGLTSILSGGYPRMVRGYEFLTRELIPRVPTALFWTIPLIVIAVYIMKGTKIGTYLYAIGSNEEGARLAGINVNRYKILTFVMSGLFTGIGSIIQFQHLGGSVPLSLNMNTMTMPLVAIVFGGTLLTGGSGGPDRTILGTLAFVVLYRGLYISLINPEILQLIVGLLLVLSIVVASRGLRGVSIT
ncbi:MAG: ABC transporter permease [Atribacterota bacterium]|jgi:ribose transport system permease protein|uniref:ABC transporter permease n=1 Tax=Atribacter sp. TaxID=2847780 RepID=UPI003D994885|nr:ABC transporter permease [Atribacterota bacterium]